MGLPQPEDNESEESVLIDALNSLDLGYDIDFADIDISHPLPSKRRDNKSVSVVKFISRKSKFDILAAKKQKRNFKYRNNDIFINEHLSPENRTLFALSSEKKKELNFKYLWTKNGVSFLRENDHSEIFSIKSHNDLLNIPIPEIIIPVNS